MGAVYALLYKYNSLRKPEYFLPINHDKEAKKTFRSTVQQTTNLLIDLLFKEENRINYTLGTPKVRKMLVNSYISCLTTLFLLDESNKGQKKKSYSFKCLKCFFRPLSDIVTSSNISNYFTLKYNLNSLFCVFFIHFILQRYWLTKRTRFLLSFVFGKKISSLTQHYFYWFKLLVYDYENIRWGTYTYKSSNILAKYKYITLHSSVVLEKFAVQDKNLLTSLSKDTLNVEVKNNNELILSDFEVAEPQSQNFAQIAVPFLPYFFYIKGSIFNKGRYPRNRQTYRTGVLWCIWLTVFTITLPSFLWYGIILKLTYVWLFFGSLIASLLLSFYLKVNSWNFPNTIFLIEQTFSKLEVFK